MSEQDKNPLENLQNAADYQGIENRIKEVDVTLPTLDSTRITGRFFYLDFADRVPNQQSFVEFIYRKIMRYCLPRREIYAAKAKYEKTGDESVFTVLNDKAVRLFVTSHSTRGAHLGEPGELIAFILLEAFFNAPQIACKMSLKTNTQMPVHGADAIHMKYHPDSDTLDLIWGEAKLYEDLHDGIKQAVESIKSFTSTDEATGQRPQDRDIEIIQDNPDVDDEAMKEAICNYFDPYSEKSGRVKHIYSCMVGYDEIIYKHLVGSTREEYEDYFKQRYIQKAVEVYNLFAKRIQDSGLSELEFILILLPFKDITQLRNSFQAKLRVSMQ